MKESSIQQTCCDWLALDGWRRIRTDLKHLRGLGVQEKGMADDLFIRYGALDTTLDAALRRHGARGRPCWTVHAEVIWVEWKSKKGVHGQKQDEWQLLERTRGALVFVAKKDFDPTVEGFQAHYAESGLLRNQSLRPRRRNAEVAGA